MLGQIGVFLVHTVFTFFIFLLLARFHFQWLRVSFRNPVGEFVLVMTSWMVMPARRVVPGLAGLDIATLLLALLVAGLSLWLQASILGIPLEAPVLALVAVIDLLRYSLYLLTIAVIALVLFSWINPETPLSPVLGAFTRPFMRPLRRFIPPVGSFDLVPLVLLIIVQVVLIVIAYLRPAGLP